MDLLFVNADTNRSTVYTPKELAREARHIVKGKGKLVSYYVRITESAHGSRTSLVASYQSRDGRIAQEQSAI